MAKDLHEENDVRSMMSGSYDDNKLDKSKELSEEMSIQESQPDEYTSTIQNLGGND